MILVNTSVWVDHLRVGDKALAALLEAGAVLVHPFVIGELALGNLRQREIVLNAISDLPHASAATDAEVLHFINRHALFGRGVGYVDAHLLAAVRLTAGAELWTNDKRLHRVADQLGLATAPARHGSLGYSVSLRQTTLRSRACKYRKTAAPGGVGVTTARLMRRLSAAGHV